MKPEKDNTFCWLPFNRLALKEWDHGKVTNPLPCCVSQNTQNDPMNWKSWKHEIENQPGNKFQNIFNHKAFKKLRHDALNNIKNPACKTCWQKEAEVGTSDRLTHANDHDSIETKLTSFDIQLDDECNLRCRMCAPWLSNKLTIDLKMFKERGAELPEAWKGSYEEEIFFREKSHQLTTTGADFNEWQYVLDNLHECKMIKFTGGEPFLSKRFNEFIDYTIENNLAKDIELNTITNATKFTDIMIKKIKNFKKFNPVFSIDGTNKTYEYIRHPMPFDKLQKSIEKFIQSDINSKSVSHNFVVSIYNIHNLYDYINFYKNFYNSDKNKIIKNVHLSIDFVHPYDGALAVKWLPNNIIKPIIFKLKGLSTKYASDKCTINIEELDGVVKYLEKALITDDSKKQEIWAKMKTDVINYDINRNQSYQDFMPSDMIEFLDSIKL
jgi:organic radical activating enzyme